MELSKRVKVAIIGLTIPLAIASAAGGMLIADTQRQGTVQQARVSTPTHVIKTTKATPAKAKTPDPITNIEPVQVTTTTAAPRPRVTVTRLVAKPTPTKTKPRTKPSVTAKAVPTKSVKATPSVIATPSLDWGPHNPPLKADGEDQ